jgi:hypothetical protein
LSVDSRLNRVTKWPPRRPTTIYREDLPRLTRALIAVIRKRGAAQPQRLRSVDYVRLKWPEGDMSVLKSDWDRIDPLILDGVFDPTAVPVRQYAVYLHYRVAFNEPVLDWADRALYGYIIGQLGLIFTETYPTSNL